MSGPPEDVGGEVGADGRAMKDRQQGLGIDVQPEQVGVEAEGRSPQRVLVDHGDLDLFAIGDLGSTGGSRVESREPM